MAGVRYSSEGTLNCTVFSICPLKCVLPYDYLWAAVSPHSHASVAELASAAAMGSSFAKRCTFICHAPKQNACRNWFTVMYLDQAHTAGVGAHAGSLTWFRETGGASHGPAHCCWHCSIAQQAHDHFVHNTTVAVAIYTVVGRLVKGFVHLDLSCSLTGEVVNAAAQDQQAPTRASRRTAVPMMASTWGLLGGPLPQ
jgi:hypothetical protein